MIQFIFILQSSFVDLAINFFTKITVWIFEKLGCLLKSVFLAVNFNSHLTGNLPELLLHNRKLCLDGYILLSKQIDTLPDIAQVGEEFFLIQVFQKWRADEFPIQPVSNRLDLRL